jgi:hypothetical protein
MLRKKILCSRIAFKICVRKMINKKIDLITKIKQKWSNRVEI